MQNSLRLFTVLVLFVLTTVSAHAQIVFDARVERVVDGDTVVLRVGDVTYRARLHGIDAPEGRQPWGPEATAVLRELLGVGESVHVEVPDIDRYGRLIVRLFARGIGAQGSEVNREMLARGAAWHYTRFDTSEAYAAAEREARAAGRGLWSDPDPVPPWEWRRR